VGVNAYNHDIQHWENISANGDVIATGVLASFYRNIGKHPQAEVYYQKLLVNVTDKSSTLNKLINASYMQNEKKAAAYAWFGRNNDIDPKKYSSGERFHELINKYSEQEIVTELEDVNSLFEVLQVNYANPELTDLNDIFN
jgi:tetratricopeptide (TPR) repeat protein